MTDDKGVIVAGPDARARAKGAKVDKKAKGDAKPADPPRDTRDSPSENPDGVHVNAGKKSKPVAAS